MITVMTLRGIGEPLDAPTMCDLVTARLDFDHLVVEVPWEATYGPVGPGAGASYNDAVQRGVDLTLTMIGEDPNPVVLLGYSGGATVAGEVARQIGAGQHPRLEVTATGLVADPQMPSGVQGRTPNGQPAWGVAGQRPVPGASVHWAWAPQDPICCTPALSPLRTLADQSAAMSLVDPGAWGWDLVDRLLRGRWQPSAWNWFDVIGSIRRYGEAADAARRYLTGEHYTPYVGERVESLAADITREVTA